MKDFALDLNGCSKEDRKKVIKLAKSVGYKWSEGERFKTKEDVDTCLGFDYGIGMWYNEIPECFGDTHQMPQDWNKIQEALGVEVPKDLGYIKILKTDGDTVWHKDHVGEIFKVLEYCDNKIFTPYYKVGQSRYVKVHLTEPSTKEAFEAQEAKKKDYKYSDERFVIDINFVPKKLDILTIGCEDWMVLGGGIACEKIDDKYVFTNNLEVGKYADKIRIKELEEENKTLTNIAYSANKESFRIREENRQLKAKKSIIKPDFYTELMKLINTHCEDGLKKPDLIHKMKYALTSCELS